MKSMLTTIALLLLIPAYAMGASQSQSSIQAWQGEWGQWASDGRGHYYGASISLFACDSTTLTCRFRYNSESAESRCSSSREEESVFRINDSTGKAQFMDYEGKPADCYLNFEKIEASGKRELRLINQSGGKCAEYCTAGLNFPSAYPFKSIGIYPSLHTAQCFADPRKSREIWCADQQIQRLDQQLNETRLRIDALKRTNEHRKVPEIREEILARCNGAEEVRECLFSSLTKASSSMQLLEKKAREDYDSEVKALLTPGNPIDGSKLIRRMEGVYNRKFQNTLASGEKYASENVLEIVRISDNAAYFRTHLEFYNGASCGLSGLARYSIKGILVFDDPEPPSWADDTRCRLRFEETSDEIRLLDPDGSCARAHCGIRGGFDREAFPVSSRRPIPNMTKLKNSKEYRKSLEQLKR